MLQSHIDIINLSYYYNKKQPRDAIVYILHPFFFFFVAIILVVLCLFSCSDKVVEAQFQFGKEL